MTRAEFRERVKDAYGEWVGGFPRPTCELFDSIAALWPEPKPIPRSELSEILRAHGVFDKLPTPFQMLQEITDLWKETICITTKRPEEPSEDELDRIMRKWFTTLGPNYAADWVKARHAIMSWATGAREKVWCEHWKRVGNGDCWTLRGEDTAILSSYALTTWDICPFAGCHKPRPQEQTG